MEFLIQLAGLLASDLASGTVQRRLKAFGIAWLDEVIQRVRVEGFGGEAIVAGHKDNRPSASLYQLADGAIAYRDWHRLSGQEWLPLATVRAALGYGEVKQLNKGELAVWQTRLLIEAGLIAPAPVTLLPLPDGESETVHKVYEGFRRLLGCKYLRESNAPTAFAHEER